MECEHPRIKKNFPFGKHSKADKFCKDCSLVMTNKMIREIIAEKRRKRREGWR